MYRVFLFITFLVYCSSVPFTRPNVRKPVINAEQEDFVDMIENSGSGYSYFKKQTMDGRSSGQSSSVDIPLHDLSAYMQSSSFDQQPIRKQSFSSYSNPLLNNAFGQQQLNPRSNLPIQSLLPRTSQKQQPIFKQNDFPQLPLAIPNHYASQQPNFPMQSQFGYQQQQQQQQPDLRGSGSQQLLFPQSNLNIQQPAFNGFGNQQPQQQMRSSQQKSAGFSSSYGGQGQQPISSGYLLQSSQQNEQEPITDALFLTPQYPPQRFISSKQQVSNNGW